MAKLHNQALLSNYTQCRATLDKVQDILLNMLGGQLKAKLTWAGNIWTVNMASSKLS